MDHLKTNMLRVCIDSNVYISAIAFGGKPLQILGLALERKFYLITSSVILTEVKRNLVEKLKVPALDVQQVINDLLAVATMYEPLGEVLHIPHPKDTLVLETALLADADILVTGDKKDFLRLKNFNNIIIESPSAFLDRIGTLEL